MEIIKKLLFQKIITRPVGRQLFITQGRGELEPGPGSRGRCLRETADNDDDLLLQQKRATPYFVDHICKFLEVLDSWDVEMPISICSAVYHIFCTHKVATEYPIWCNMQILTDINCKEICQSNIGSRSIRINQQSIIGNVTAGLQYRAREYPGEINIVTNWQDLQHFAPMLPRHVSRGPWLTHTMFKVSSNWVIDWIRTNW